MREGRRAVAGLMAAETISTLGTEMTWLAVPWLVLESTGSPAKMGLVMAAELAPVGLVTILGGSITARLGARRTAIVCEATRAPIFFTIALLAALGRLDLVTLLVLVAIAGAMIAPQLSAQRVLLAEIQGERAGAVVRTGAGLQAATRAATLLGPLVAGLVISLFGSAAAIALDGLSYLVSWGVLSVSVPRSAGAPGPGRPRPVGAVWRWLRSDPIVRRLAPSVILSELGFQLLAASLPVLTLLYYDLGPEVAGILFSCWAGGALVGNLLVIRFWGDEASLGPASLAGAGAAVFAWALVASQSVAILALLLAAVGVCTGLRSPAVLGTCMLRAPAVLRSQVTVLIIGLSLCAAPIALGIAGPAMQWFGPLAALIGAAFLTSLSALMLFAAAREEGSSMPSVAGAVRRIALSGPRRARPVTRAKVSTGERR